jgi:hypothetical protein
MNNELLDLIIQNSALKLGCEKALALLEDGDAEPSDADNVIRILKSVLEIK